MKLKRALFIAVVTSFLMQQGCMSYSFRGDHFPKSQTSASDSQQQYRLNRYSSNIPLGLTPWSIPRYADAQMSKREIESYLVQLYPELFTRDQSALPVDVTVHHIESKRNAWGLVSYFLTMGVYPSNILCYKDECDVFVSINGEKQKKVVKFRSNSWLSVWTPFGLYRKDSEDEYTGAHQYGKGIMSAPHTSMECLNAQKAVFASEVAAAIKESFY